MPKYEVYVSWQMSTTLEIEAENEEQATEMAMRRNEESKDLLAEGIDAYVHDSFKVDLVMEEPEMSREEKFAPLRNAMTAKGYDKNTRQRVLAAYMFMTTEPKGDSVVYAYKHTVTRQYVRIYKDGAVSSGHIDTTEHESI